MPAYLQRIHAARPFRSKSFNKLARYLMDRFVEAAFMTAAQLAHATDVDVGTVVRFAQHLGYRGFPELQADVQEHVRQLFGAIPSSAASPFHTTLTTLAQAIIQGARRIPPTQVQEWLDLLTTGHRVILVHRSVLSAPANQLQMALIDHKVPVLTVSPEALVAGPEAIQTEDIVLALESTAQDATMQQVLQLARKRGAIPAVISPRASSPCALLADRVLSAHLEGNTPYTALVVAVLTLGMAEALTQTTPTEVTHETDPFSAR